MRIISKHKDYYDHGMSYGIDTDIVFERKVKLFSYHPFEKTGIETYTDSNNKNIVLSQFVVIVAGKMYRGKHILDTDVFLYTHDEQNEHFFQNGIRDRYWYDPKREFFNKSTDLNTDQQKWIITNNVVVGITNGGGILEDFPNQEVSFVANHSLLKKVHFYNVKNSMEVFNDISMWIGNNKVKEIVTLNNDEKLIKAGFDKKISFRNPIK